MEKVIEEIKVPVKIIDGKVWFSFMNIMSKATVRSIGMAKKPRRVRDTGHHHCFEIDVEGNIRIHPKKWPVL